MNRHYNELHQHLPNLNGKTIAAHTRALRNHTYIRKVRFSFFNFNSLWTIVYMFDYTIRSSINVYKTVLITYQQPSRQITRGQMKVEQQQQNPVQNNKNVHFHFCFVFPPPCYIYILSLHLVYVYYIPGVRVQTFTAAFCPFPFVVSFASTYTSIMSKQPYTVRPSFVFKMQA